MDQPCALLIGLTKSVQPYCRFAINNMQPMPTINCVQRAEMPGRAAASVVVAMTGFHGGGLRAASQRSNEGLLDTFRTPP